MPAILEKVKVLSVRLPETEIRSLKEVAARNGISVQEAVHRAVELWLLEVATRQMEALDALQGSWTGGEDVDTMRRKEREFEFAKDARWSK